jgi:hypothetical protein
VNRISTIFAAGQRESSKETRMQTTPIRPARRTAARLLLVTVSSLALALGVIAAGWAASAKTTRISVGS